MPDVAMRIVRGLRSRRELDRIEVTVVPCGLFLLIFWDPCRCGVAGDATGLCSFLETTN